MIHVCTQFYCSFLSKFFVIKLLIFAIKDFWDSQLQLLKFESNLKHVFGPFEFEVMLSFDDSSICQESFSKIEIGWFFGGTIAAAFPKNFQSLVNVSRSIQKQNL